MRRGKDAVGKRHRGPKRSGHRSPRGHPSTQTLPWVPPLVGLPLLTGIPCTRLPNDRNPSLPCSPVLSPQPTQRGRALALGDGGEQSR